jgi:hypothetical protein
MRKGGASILVDPIVSTIEGGLISLTVQGPPNRVGWIIGVVPGILGLALVGLVRLRGGAGTREIER